MNLNLNLNSLRLQQTSSKRRFNKIIHPLNPLEFDPIHSKLTKLLTVTNFNAELFCFTLDSLASPATSKIGLRMTTLHEEPSTRHTLTEEIEEYNSDSELSQYHDDSVVTKPPLKSRFPTSKTMGSLRDIGNNFQSVNSSTNIVNSTAKNVRQNVTNSIAKQMVGTPSMTSSTSSGYGSQVRKSFRIHHTNDWNSHEAQVILNVCRPCPIAILPMMMPYRCVLWALTKLQVSESHWLVVWATLTEPRESVYCILDFDRTGSSPPKRNAQSTTTPYTPSSGQKRFNPFMKDTPSSGSTPNELISSSQTTTAEHATNHKNNSKSSTITQQQNDENKNIILVDDNNQNLLTTTTSATHKKLTTNDNQHDDNAKMVNSFASDCDPNELNSSQHTEAPLPDWVQIDESVLIRPYNTSGVISFIGPTHFQVRIDRSGSCFETNNLKLTCFFSCIGRDVDRRWTRYPNWQKWWNRTKHPIFLVQTKARHIRSCR